MNVVNRNEVLAQAETLIRKTPFTKEDKARVDSLLSLADTLMPYERKSELREARMDQLQRELNGDRPIIDRGSEYERCFENWLRSGEKHLAAEMRAYTPQTTVPGDHAGGELVPQGFAVAIAEASRAVDAFLGATTLVPTARGNGFSHPAIDDGWTEAEIVNENSISQDGVIGFAHVSWGECPRWSSGWVLAPVELVQDTGYDLPTLLSRIFGRRFARGIGRYFIDTMLAAADSALTSASASAVTGDEILQLADSVDSDAASNGSFIMSFPTLLKIQQLKASTGGSYLFPAATDAAGFPLLLGKRVLISPSMPSLTAGQTAIAFGDCSQMLRREVTGSLRLLLANERWIESGQFGYQAQIRVDGALVVSANPSSVPPIRVITQHA